MIFSLEEAAALNWETSRGNNIVLALGCFDVLHSGHIKHLEDARALGDCLVVGLSSDKYVKELKGNLRPIVSENDRAKVLDSLSCVSDVVVIPEESAASLIETIKPKRFVRGEDHIDEKSHAADIERLACENNGGKVVYTEGRLNSSSRIINRAIHKNNTIVDEIYELHVEEVRHWLDLVKRTKRTAQIVGEQITDRYIYVTPAGKSTKENTISYVRQWQEEFRGGIDAVKMHLSQTCVPDIPRYSNEISIEKTRILDEPFQAKLFSIAENTEVPTLSGREVHAISNESKDYDITCIADFGHGLISNDQASHLSEITRDTFLALTVQSNSLNFGFNTLRKWNSASYVVADEDELRLSCEDSKADLYLLVQKEFNRLGVSVLAVTCGHDGCIIYDGSSVVRIPALGIKVVDRMGAGDAFFGWTIPFVLSGAPSEVIGIIGNIAGAVHVSSIGNGKPVSFDDIERMLDIIEK